jgi:hypothetical protein
MLHLISGARESRIREVSVRRKCRACVRTFQDGTSNTFVFFERYATCQTIGRIWAEDGTIQNLPTGLNP